MSFKILKEDGDALLKEDGGALLLELSGVTHEGSATLSGVATLTAIGEVNLYEYYNTGDDSHDSTFGFGRCAQTFTPLETHTITSVKLELFRYGSPGTIDVEIRTTSAGVPTDTVLCSGTTDGDTLTTNTNGEWREITLGGGYELQADTKYAIVIYASSGDGSNNVRWLLDTTDAAYTGGQYCYISSVGNGGWNMTFTTYDLMFKEYGTVDIVYGSATLTGIGTLIVAATVIPPILGSATLTGTGSLTASGSIFGAGITGYVHRIVREYDRGVYRITVYLGGVTGGYTVPGGESGGGLAEADPPRAPTEIPDVDWSTILPKAVQGYTHDIIFSATDWDTIAWTSGTLTFYDETTQAIASGNTGNLSTDAIYFIYFDLDDASPNVLKVCTKASYMSTYFSEYTSVLCVIQRSSDVSIDAGFLPGVEKQSLIVADWIHMASLKEKEFDDGTSIVSIHSTDIQAGHIKLVTCEGDLDDITDGGTYEKVLATDISSGHIVLSSCEGDLSDIDGDLDDIANGSTYAKVRETEISAGYIRLTSSTVKSGEWYDEGGVVIDASAGITLIGNVLTYKYGTTTVGNIYGYSTSTLNIMVPAGKGISLGAGATMTVAGWIGMVGFEGVDMSDEECLLLPEKTSAPSSPTNGMMVYNPTTSNINIYDGSAWWHTNRDAGWA